MNHKKFMFIVIIVAVACFPMHAPAYQMVKKDNKSPSLTFESDLNNDGISEKITLVKRLPDREADVLATAAIKVEPEGKSFLKEIGLINRHESSLELLRIGVNQKNFIVLSQPIGIDGWRIRLYSFNGNAVSEELSAYSDRPSIDVKDADGDGVAEVVVLNRDTQNNPGEDNYVITYKYTDNKWRVTDVYRTATKEHIADKDWPNIIKN